MGKHLLPPNFFVRKFTEKVNVFKDIDKLISHINEYWQNIESWWFNASTQKSIAAYNKAFNMLPNKNSLKDLSKELSL